MGWFQCSRGRSLSHTDDSPRRYRRRDALATAAKNVHAENTDPSYFVSFTVDVRPLGVCDFFIESTILAHRKRIATRKRDARHNAVPGVTWKTRTEFRRLCRVPLLFAARHTWTFSVANRVKVRSIKTDPSVFSTCG